MTLLVDFLSWACILAGGALSVIGGIGMIRLPDLFTRMHAAGVIDTLGMGLIILGLIFQGGFTLVTVKLIIIVVFIIFTSPTATHALAKAALHGGVKPRGGEAEASQAIESKPTLPDRILREQEREPSNT